MADLPKAKAKSKGTVGMLIMRSYVLAGNTAHYDAMITALEAQGEADHALASLPQ